MGGGETRARGKNGVGTRLSHKAPEWGQPVPLVEDGVNLLGQIPSFPELLHILLLDGRDHPSASCSGYVHLWKTSLRWKRRVLGR